jgi:hypothetical protein
MTDHQEITNLNELLERFRRASQERDSVSLGAIVNAVGRSSFGPLLLLAGLITLSPVA